METYSVNIISKTIEEARALQAMDLDLKYRAARRTAPARFVTPGILNSDQLDALLAAGYKVDVVADMTQVAKQRRLEISKVNRFADAQSVRDFDTRNVMGYMTTAEIDSAMHDYSRHLNAIIQILEEAGFLYGLKPSDKGMLASRIYGENSLIVTEALYQGYAWAYRRVFSHASIWRRRPRQLAAVPAYLGMSYLYKKSNRFWWAASNMACSKW